MTTNRSLAHMPVTLFAAVMGLGSLALAWRRTAVVWEFPLWYFHVLIALTTGIYVLILTAYAMKWILHPAAARAELNHPMRMPFVPTMTISTLIVATGLAPIVPAVANVLWWIGAIGHLGATLLVLSSWFNRTDIAFAQVTPAWLIPIVGNVVTPLAINEVGNTELAWFSFGVGVTFWLGILPMLLRRLIAFEQPIPTKMLPTLAVMVAPPSVSFISWTQLGGDPLGPVARILFAAAWAMAFLVLAQFRTLVKVRFMLPYLAYTFPFGALAVASLITAGAHQNIVYNVLATTALIVATGGILGIVSGVAGLVVRGKVFEPEK